MVLTPPPPVDLDVFGNPFSTSSLPSCITFAGNLPNNSAFFTFSLTLSADLSFNLGSSIQGLFQPSETFPVVSAFSPPPPSLSSVSILHPSILIPPVPYFKTFSATVFSDTGFLANTTGSCAGLSAVPQPSYLELPFVSMTSTLGLSLAIPPCNPSCPVSLSLLISA